MRKALSFFKENNLEVDFIDFKKESPTLALIQDWTKQIDIDLLLNSKGAKYKNLNLKELNLNLEQKIQHLHDEPMLFKRPLISFDSKILLGFNEDSYKNTFL